MRVLLASLLVLLLAPAPTPPRDAAPAGGGLLPTSLPIVDHDFRLMTRRTRARLRCEEAHRTATGKGVVVAVLDGGFDLRHPALRGRLSALRYDALDRDRDPHDPGNGRDDDRDGVVDRAAGHGTFVAGMVLLAAPDAVILPVRVRDDEGHGTNAALLRGLDFALLAGAQVVNLSVTLGPTKPEAVLDRLAALRAAGLAIVAAGGNDGGARLTPLASSPDVLAAVAVDAEDRLASFSSRPDGTRAVAAPGVALHGPLTRGRSGTWSGTSFAAGLVSGAAALVRQRRPDLPASDLLDHLVGSGDLLEGSALPRINLAKAVAR